MLLQQGIEARVFHVSLGLLRHMTGEAYQQIAGCWGLNEFTFTGILDDGLSAGQELCLMERALAQTDLASTQAFPNAASLGKAIIEMRHDIVPRYLLECTEEIIAYRPTMVGFSCMFDQTLASVALATLLKQSQPNLQVIFGGYALEGPPGVEVLRAFPCVDAIAIGDGEPLIAELARASVGAVALDSIPGVRTRSSSRPTKGARFDLRTSPAPNYHDWFEDLAQLRKADRVTLRTTVLPVESSRGCWWGQKHHCVFCGIDEDTLKYRSKEADTVLSQLAEIRSTYGGNLPMRFSDYIFPHGFFTELLPRLADIQPNYDLQCEIKANQTAGRVKAFADAGFSELQPGIESFDSNVLRIMDKGVTGIQNVHLLRQGYVNGIQINYNILYGLPGEKSSWYKTMTERLSRLFHFTPPVTRTETIVTRFAPLQANPSRFGISESAKHHRCYDVLFSDQFLERTGFELDNYSYYFERNFEIDPECSQYYWTLIRLVDQWKQQHRERTVELSFEVEGDRLLIFDSRRKVSSAAQRLSKLESQILLAANAAPITRTSLCEHLSLTRQEIEKPIESLDRKELIWLEDDLVLNLAVPRDIAENHLSKGWQYQWTALYA